MADLLIKGVPMPIPRPIRIMGGEVDATMPLESPEKAADALFSERGTLPTPENKSISTGFLEARDWNYEEWIKYMNELYSQFYGWLTEIPDYKLLSAFLDFLLVFLLSLSVLFTVNYFWRKIK